MYTPVHDTKTFAKGDCFIREGEEATAAYLINKGQVEIFRRQGEDEQTIATLGPGEIVGEMALIEQREHTSSVRALSQTDVLVVTADLLDEKIRKADSLLKVIIKALVSRLENMDNKLAG